MWLFHHQKKIFDVIFTKIESWKFVGSKGELNPELLHEMQECWPLHHRDIDSRCSRLDIYYQGCVKLLEILPLYKIFTGALKSRMIPFKSWWVLNRGMHTYHNSIDSFKSNFNNELTKYLFQLILCTKLNRGLVLYERPS